MSVQEILDALSNSDIVEKIVVIVLVQEPGRQALRAAAFSKEGYVLHINDALGNVNFLFDKSQVPHLRADELAGLFGVSQKTAANKARQIREILKIRPLDPKWWRPSKMDKNPLAWLVVINGLVVDARSLPREIQEGLARRGLIPFVPSEKMAEPKEMGR